MASPNLHLHHQTTLSLPPASYIYDICRCGPGALAAISSDDSLRCFDRRTLDVLAAVPQTHRDGVTGLAEFRGQQSHEQGSQGSADLLVTGGRDGAVRIWDLREGKGRAVVEFNTDKSAPVTAITCDAQAMSVVAGTEYTSRQASVLLWDVRSPGAHRVSYVESHNDDITALEFHPTRKNLLLSGSTDALVNIYDTSHADEDEALKQVINHGSVHRAGFLGDDYGAAAATAVYALSHDETFAIHPLDDCAEGLPDQPLPPPVQFGDVRPLLGCNYAVRVLAGRRGFFLASGKAGEEPTEQRLSLTPIVPDSKWSLLSSQQWQLPGAHGEEIVRSVYIDDEIQTVFTCGEDGVVRAWKGEEEEGEDQSMLQPAAAATTSPRARKHSSEHKSYRQRKHGETPREQKYKRFGFSPY